ncbi:MAG: T9SS type A sorting domain-containing protein [Bacteroidota bacterium]
MKVVVTFLPPSVGSFADTVVVNHDGTVGPPIKIPLSGTGPNTLSFLSKTGATLTTLALANAFPNQLRSDTIYVKNSSGSTVTVTGITTNSPEYSILVSPTTINNNDSGKVVVGLVATSVGRKDDTLKVAHNSALPGSSPLKLPISARATGSFVMSATTIGAPLDTNVMRVNAANTGITPGTVYPAVAVDSTRPLTIYLRNIGTTIFGVDSIKFQTPNFYSVQPTPFTMRPGDNDVYQLLLQFRYQPLDVSSPTYRDTVTLFTNDTIPGGNRVRVAVEGASRNAVYILTQRSRQDLNYGTVPIYSSSSDSTVRVHNYQTGQTIIDSVRFAQKSIHFKFDTSSVAYKRVLGKGDTSLILVRFSPQDTLPTAATVKRDTLLVYTSGNALAKPYKIPVAGVASVAIVFNPSAASVNVGEIPVNGTKDTTIKVYNRTNNEYILDSLGIYSGVNFNILSNTLKDTLKVNDSLSIVIRFHPLSGGVLRDTLYIWGNAGIPTTLLAHPRKVTLVGTGSTQGIIQASNYVTVDNIEGVDGVPIASPDSTYKEVGNFWSNPGGLSFGTGHRRAPNLSGALAGSIATYTFTIDSSGPYLVYHWGQNSPNVGSNALVHFLKFGVGGIYDSIRYNLFENKTLIPGYNGTFKPLMMHYVDGLGKGAAAVRIGADAVTGAFLRVDAVRFLRSTQKADIEFGRRDVNFSSGRVPEEYPEITLGDSLKRPYRFWNLGKDTLVISNIQFFTTNSTPAARFSAFNLAGTAKQIFPIKIPPMKTNGLAETGGWYDITLCAAPFQEEVIRDSMIVSSNDDTEPKSYIILNAVGINYSFIMNASIGNTEPHYRAPAPAVDNNVTTIPKYSENALGVWQNSAAASVAFPISGGNNSSRVNTGGTGTFPHIATYEFEFPDVAYGLIPTDGNYILEYGGPGGSTNAYTREQVVVTQTFGAQPDTAYLDATTVNSPPWKQVGGGLKTFVMFPGGKISAEFQRNAATEAAGGVGFLRVDLLRVRKVPKGALVGVPFAAPDSMTIADVSFRNPPGIDGKVNKRDFVIGSRGETALNLLNVRFRSNQYFHVVNPLPSTPFQLKAVNGEYRLTVEFVPDKIARFKDTLEIYSTSSRPQDTLILVPVTGDGIGGTYLVDDDGTVTEVSATPTFAGIYANGSFDKLNITHWQREVAGGSAVVGRGTTRALLPIYQNPYNLNTNLGGRFEWYPLIPTATGESDSIYCSVTATVKAGETKASPAAHYRVFSTGASGKDTIMNQNSLSSGRVVGVGELNLGTYWFLRGGRDASGGASVFGHVRVMNDTTAVSQFYGANTNIAKRDTFGLVADAIILQELLAPRTTTGVEKEEQLPTEFSLSQNYPNPFNPTTTIKFGLPERVAVELKVYDILGREVRALFNGDQMNPGTHTVLWNGRNNANQPVATGVYFYRIIAGGYVQSMKMILLK